MVIWLCVHAQSCPTLCNPLELETTRLLCPWNFPGKNTEVGCHFLLQGIVLSQGSNHVSWVSWADSLPLAWVTQTVKNLPAMWETRVQALGQEDPPEKGMATHSSILAWRIPWQRSLVGYSSWGHKVPVVTEQLSLLHQISQVFFMILINEMYWQYH